jgi:SulP family sulfate permease
MLLVWGLTVFVDLITAVAVGVFLANIYTVKRLSDTQVQSVRVIQDDVSMHTGLTDHESSLLQEAKGKILLYQLNGPVTYAAAKGISNKLMVCKTHELLLLDFTNVPHIDVSTALALEEVILDAKLAGQVVYVVGANSVVEMILKRLKVLTHVDQSNHYKDRETALTAASQLLTLTLPNSEL